MIETPDTLHPASPQEVADALSFALRFNRGKRDHGADDAMSRITADRLIEHLRMCGFVVMKRPGLGGHGGVGGR
jgi:hypothetical protein